MIRLYIQEGLFGFDVIRQGKPVRSFTKHSEAVKFVNDQHGKKRHVWDMPAGDYFSKRYECKDCGLKRSYHKKDGKHFNSYSLEGVHYDIAPPCKFKEL